MLKRIVRFIRLCLRNRLAGKASVLGQLQDFIFFRRTTMMGPLEFHQYRLWDRRLPIEERLAYLSFKEHCLIEAATNPRALSEVLKDKGLTAKRLAHAGVPMPRTLGWIEPPHDGQHGAKPDAAHIARLLSAIVGDGIINGLVIKRNDGWGGSGVHVFTQASADGFVRVDGSFVGMDDLAVALSARAASWIVEERISPHPVLANVVAHSLSTLRILTFRSRNGRIHIGPAALKLPVGNQGLDNFGAGNLAASVDPVTGRVGRGVYYNVGDDVSRHPESGVCFEGLTVPDFERVKQLTLAAATEIHELASIGWDIAVTPDGPRIVEGNVWWSNRLLQMPQHTGLVQGQFAELLEEYGLGCLLARRQRAAAHWKRKHKSFAAVSSV